MRYIGDVHGKWDLYEKVMHSCTESIQVGDFGIGFGAEKWNPSPKHRFVRGNHDNLALCKMHPNFMFDGQVFVDQSAGNLNGIAIGGAKSIDYKNRVEGVDWWRDEELSYEQLYNIIDLVVSFKPDIIVSHTCPQVAVDEFRFDRLTSITEQALSRLFEVYQPKHWIFGHFHKSVRKVIDGTRFVGLGIGEAFDLKG